VRSVWGDPMYLQLVAVEQAIDLLLAAAEAAVLAAEEAIYWLLAVAEE
jgi:hypothetical protein